MRLGVNSTSMSAERNELLCTQEKKHKLTNALRENGFIKGRPELAWKKH